MKDVAQTNQDKPVMNNIEKVGIKNCSGCSLCSLLCPKESIEMKMDTEGFLQPVINHDTCINCGLCYKKCPSVGETEKHHTPVYYASAIKNKEKLLRSSSGGNFYALANRFIVDGGYVCGCVFDERTKAVHICTNSMSDVERMMGSKYVQSTVTECLKEAKKLIGAGRRVLFTGTACQVAAAKEFLKNNELLYTVDILCHGVPSPLFLSKYVDYLEKKHKGELVKLDFRNKQELGWGSEHRTYYEIKNEKGTKGYRPKIPAYFCAFFWSLNLRESCYNCKFAGKDRVSDITIGDFWGYWAYFKKQFPEGISIASVNTEKGKELYNQIKDNMDFCIELPEDKAKGTNTNFYHPTPRPSSRDMFYKGLKDAKYEDFRLRTYLNKDSRKKLLISAYGRFVPEWIKRIIRK